MRINWFIFAQGVLCIGASIQETIKGNVNLAVAYAAWSVSNFALAFIGGSL